MLTICNAGVTRRCVDVLKKRVRVLTANQLVALKVEELRKKKDWTQLQTVGELARFGLHWSRVNYAMAVVASSKGKRIREFNADEIVVFAQVFDVSIWSLFVPPAEESVMVSLPNGQQLDSDAMFDRAYARTAPKPPSNKREMRLQEEMLSNVVKRLFDHLRPDRQDLRGADPRGLRQIQALSEQMVQITEAKPKTRNTRKNGTQTQRT
jgi:hypothetical protein